MNQTLQHEKIKIWWYGEWREYRLYDKNDQALKSWYGKSFPHIIGTFVSIQKEFEEFLNTPPDDHNKKESLTDWDKEHYPNAFYKIIKARKGRITPWFVDLMKKHTPEDYNELLANAQTRLEEITT